MEVLARGAAGLLMVAMPLALGAYLVRRFQTGWRLLLVGAAVFVVSQIVHIPFNSYVLGPLMARLGLGAAGAGWPLAGAAVLLGLSAGVFEEVARWLAYRFWVPTARGWKRGVAFGAGHGGAESFLVGLLSLATLIQLAALRGQDLSTVVPADQLALAEAQVEAYWALPPWAAFFAPLERASALAIQISLSVVVLQAFVRPGGLLWLGLAIGWHGFIDAAAVYAGVVTGVGVGNPNGMLVTEAVVVLLALVSLAILFRLRPEDDDIEILPPAPPPHTGPVAGGSLDPGRIDDSRFVP